MSRYELREFRERESGSFWVVDTQREVVVNGVTWYDKRTRKPILGAAVCSCESREDAVLIRNALNAAEATR